MKRLDSKVFKAVAEHVAEEACKRSLSGMFVMADLGQPENLAFFSHINRPTCLRIGVEGKRDINFLAVAFSKLAGVVAHSKDTGEETQIFGEVPYKGGHLSEDEQFVYAFSGASAEEDLELAKSAEAFHGSLSDKEGETLVGVPPVPQSQLRAALGRAYVSEIYQDMESKK